MNRTWVHLSWRTDQAVKVENYVDKFWLLGEGNVNGNTSFLKDDEYDTSKFTDIFTNNSSRIRKLMKEDGTKGSAYSWWLRSAYSDDSRFVGFVFGSGEAYYSVAGSYNAVLPVCLIG